MSETSSIRECYNTKIIPMRSGRGIAGAHVKYKRGDDGSDRVLCVAPQFFPAKNTLSVPLMKMEETMMSRSHPLTSQIHNSRIYRVQTRSCCRASV